MSKITSSKKHHPKILSTAHGLSFIERDTRRQMEYELAQINLFSKFAPYVKEYPILNEVTENTKKQFLLLIPLIKKIEQERDLFNQKKAKELVDEIAKTFLNLEKDTNGYHWQTHLNILSERINEAALNLNNGWREVLNHFMNTLLHFFLPTYNAQPSETSFDVVKKTSHFFFHPIVKEAQKIHKGVSGSYNTFYSSLWTNAPSCYDITPPTPPVTFSWGCE